VVVSGITFTDAVFTFNTSACVCANIISIYITTETLMTRKTKQWCSTIPSISTKRTITSRLNPLIKQKYHILSHKTSPLVIEMSVPSQENKRSCIYVLGVSILSLFLWLLI